MCAKPVASRPAMESLLHDGMEEPLGPRTFGSHLEWVVFEALCAEAGVAAPLSLHELLPAGGLGVDSGTTW